MKRRSGIKIMAQLIVLMKPLALYIIIAIFLGVLGFLCATGVPVTGAMGMLVLFGFPSPVSLRILICILFACAILRGILRYGEQASNHYIAFRLLAVLRDMVFSALRKLCPAKLEGKDKGNLIALITNDIELLEVFYAHTVSPIAIGFITSCIFVVSIGSISPVLGVIAALAYIAVGAVTPLLNGKRVNTPGMAYRTQSGDLNSFVLESLRGMSELIQYAQTDQRKKEMDEKTEELANLQNHLKACESTNRSISDFFVFAFDVVMIFAAVHLHMIGTISFDHAVLAIVILMSSYGPVMALSNLSNNLAQTLASGERVLSLLEEKPETEEQTNGIEAALSDIRCEQVHFRYGDVEVLNNLSLHIPEGKITGIHGRSGCGKSTLLKLIMRFWDKNSGKILLSGHDVRDINTHCLRQNESYCTQETHLFNDTIGNNIKLANPKASDAEMIAAAKAASIHDFISELPLGYDTHIGELGNRLSSGEKQRIGIARALLSPANIILLDEPTSNLDSLNEGIILKSLDEATDKTIVLVSHRKSTLGIADQVLSIENGRIC